MMKPLLDGSYAHLTNPAECYFLAHNTAQPKSMQAVLVPTALVDLVFNFTVRRHGC